MDPKSSSDQASALPPGGIPTIPTTKLAEFDKSWTAKRLANGMTAVHVPTPYDDHFYLGLMIRTGSRMESEDNMGISHFLEHMLFRGSKRYPEFTKLAEAFEWLGGDWNAATGQEHTEYWYSGIRHTSPQVMELFAEFLENPLLADIEVERRIIQRELEGEMNDHGHSTDLDYHAATILWPGSSMAQPIVGTPETIDSLSSEELKAYRDRYYVPQNMAICAVGGSPGDETLALLEKHFASHRAFFTAAPQPAYPALTKFKGPLVKWVEHSDNEYGIQLSFRLEGEWSGKAQTYELITRILTDGFCSRLGRRLREELGLVYNVSADTSLYLETGSLDITADVAPADLDQFFDELLPLLKRLAVDGPSTDELERARLRSLVDLELSCANPEFVASRLSWGAICGKPVSLEEDRRRTMAVTSSDLKQTCDEIFRPDKTGLVVLGPTNGGLESRLKKAILAQLGPASG